MGLSEECDSDVNTNTVSELFLQPFMTCHIIHHHMRTRQGKRGDGQIHEQFIQHSNEGTAENDFKKKRKKKVIFKITL